MSTTPLFELLAGSPVASAAPLAELLGRRYPRLRAWLAQCPAGARELPTRIADEDDGLFLRLPEQYRSVTLPLARLGEAEPGVLVIKGCEPLLTDFPAFVDWMVHRTFRAASNVGHASMLEHFALREHKLGGALTQAEAVREAGRALELQRAHLRHYGTLARAPTPVYVDRIAPAALSEASAAWQRWLPEAARERLWPLAEQGLAIYAYHYPALPVRVRILERALPGEDRAAVRARVRGYPIEAIIEGWVTLMMRMLYLGFLPYSHINESLGACFDRGNACMDGGFVDLDSLLPIADLEHEGQVFDALVASLLGLDRTVEQILPADCEYETRQIFRRHYLWDLFRRAAVSEARPGLSLDPRVNEVLEPLPFARMVERLRSRKRYAEDFLDASVIKGRDTQTGA